MNVNKILVCQFRPGNNGPYCEQPIGHGPQFGRVYPHKKNVIDIKVGVKYLCRVVHSPDTRTHFVTVVKSAQDVLKVLPELCEADWKRGPHVTDGIKTEFTVCGEMVTATWYQSTGRFPTKFVTLNFKFEGEDISFSVAESDARVEIALIEKRVRKCTGPAVALGAVISRQRDSRQSAWR